LGLQWDPNDDMMLYARYSRGYKAGAFNAGSGVRFPEADPESVDAFEVGLKSNLIDGLQANVSAFYYDYRDRQTPVTVPADGVTYLTNTSIFENVPKSISQGVEVETIWTPFEDAHFNVTYAYLDAYVDDSGPGYIDGFNPTAGAQNLSGSQLPLSPKHRVTVHGDYTLHFENAGSLYLGASFIWRDEQYGAFFNQPYYYIPSGQQTDLQAIWKSDEGDWSVLANVKNVFDEEVVDAVFPSLRVTVPSTVVYKTTSLAPPRTYGLEVRKKF
jgi:iron complex outermembrane receptor protein